MFDTCVDADPVYRFVRNLPKRVDQYVKKVAEMECSVNHFKAPTKWYKGDKRIEVCSVTLLFPETRKIDSLGACIYFFHFQTGSKFEVSKDPLGKITFKINDCQLEDSAVYTCKINEENFTKCKVVVTGTFCSTISICPRLISLKNENVLRRRQTNNSSS